MDGEIRDLPQKTHCDIIVGGGWGWRMGSGDDEVGEKEESYVRDEFIQIS